MRRHGRHVGEHAEPAKRIDPFEFGDAVLHGLAAHAVEAVTSRDEVALQLVRHAVFLEGERRAIRVEPVNLRVRCFVESREALGGARSTHGMPNGSMTDPVIADLCALITRAERAGLRTSRAARWREIVASGALSDGFSTRT